MDRYLTNSRRSIPKLIILDANTIEELDDWRPKPQRAVNYFSEMRKNGIKKSKILENIRRRHL